MLVQTAGGSVDRTVAAASSTEFFERDDTSGMHSVLTLRKCRMCRQPCATPWTMGCQSTAQSLFVAKLFVSPWTHRHMVVTCDCCARNSGTHAKCTNKLPVANDLRTSKNVCKTLAKDSLPLPTRTDLIQKLFVVTKESAWL